MSLPYCCSGEPKPPKVCVRACTSLRFIYGGGGGCHGPFCAILQDVEGFARRTCACRLARFDFTMIMTERYTATPGRIPGLDFD